MAVQERIMQALRTGENNAVSLAEMCKVSGINSRATRQIIEDLRRSGCVIISAVDGGYYKPANTMELKRFIHKENSRALSVLTTLKSARKLLKKWDGESKFEGNIYKTGDINND